MIYPEGFKFSNNSLLFVPKFSHDDRAEQIDGKIR